MAVKSQGMRYRLLIAGRVLRGQRVVELSIARAQERTGEGYSQLVDNGAYTLRKALLMRESAGRGANLSELRPVGCYVREESGGERGRGSRRGVGRLHSKESARVDGALKLELHGLDLRPGSVALSLELITKTADSSEVVLRGLE